MFLVTKGNLIIHFGDQDEHINEGEFIIIPKMVEHKPEALEEVHIVLFEPKTTLNTGNVVSDETVENQETILLGVNIDDTMYLTAVECPFQL